ncbi:hypothetical protein K788_0006207 (plasmid) [Paraburkholderia caribensis MBA4]|uniref:Uncharacterized protein n=1 Tax=Paraburkholderia caribensis MBA4 TaxID=1323664 RepID=A0A0N7JVN6_9BURK|nr:hypothetical protein K788_0006207 [Paraburkholderia caribensis MBA4]
MTRQALERDEHTDAPGEAYAIVVFCVLALLTPTRCMW